MIQTGIITISDRASQGVYEDFGGPALRAAALGNGWQVQAEVIVPDDLDAIQSAVRSLESQGCGLILTTGGTGIAERDVTPEAIRGIMRVELPGFGEVMRMRSLEITPNAILSRCLAAVVGRSLVVALPGKPQGAVECLGFVLGAIPHAVKLSQRVPTSC
jgi:molybdopterin adenylyltransferase